MAYNHGKAEYKWKLWKEREEKILRDSRREASLYPFSRNSAFAARWIFSKVVPFPFILHTPYITVLYNSVMEVCKINGNGTTLENIHRAAKEEFLEKGYKDASLRNIVKSVGMTTGAFYGYYKSKEELFEAIVGEHYEYIRNRFIKAQQEFAELPAAQQPEVMSDISGICMYDILYYAYEHLEECKLILCCSEGTKFAGLIDEMVEIEVDGTHAYQDVLRQLGRPSPHIDPSLEHILITGMLHTFFELIIHEMPLKDAENYVKEMRAFYTAGWMKIMGQ